MGEVALDAVTGDLYVSSVEGRPVTRFGTTVLVGAARDSEQRNKIRYDTQAIVCIPRVEWTRYFREYQRAFIAGDLVQRTQSEWQSKQTQLNGEPPPESAEDAHADSEGRRQQR